MNNSSTYKAAPFRRGIRNYLLDIQDFFRSIDKSSYSFITINCFNFLKFLLDSIINIFSFQERFLASLSKEFVGGLLSLYLLE